METDKFEEFTWFLPEEKNPLALTIPNIDTININAKLLPQLPSHFTIGVKERGRLLCIRAHEKGFHPCKSGSIKGVSKPIIDRIVADGVCLPARYAVKQEGDCWIARLEVTAPPALKNRPISRSKRMPRG